MDKWDFGFVAVVCAVIAIGALLIAAHNEVRKECEAKGGAYVDAQCLDVRKINVR